MYRCAEMQAGGGNRDSCCSCAYGEGGAPSFPAVSITR